MPFSTSRLCCAVALVYLVVLQAFFSYFAAPMAHSSDPIAGVICTHGGNPASADGDSGAPIHQMGCCDDCTLARSIDLPALATTFVLLVFAVRSHITRCGPRPVTQAQAPPRPIRTRPHAPRSPPDLRFA